MSSITPLIALGQAAEPASRTPLVIIGIYMCVLFALGWISSRLFRGSSKDFFVASHSIGPFMLLMSVFGTTMTAFALVGSTGKAFSLGVGTYGLMASSSGLIHAACFFFVGIRMWSFGKKYGYVTQIQFFRDRFESKGLGYLMFPILVGLIIPYLLVGLIGAGNYIGGVTAGMFPETFSLPDKVLPSGKEIANPLNGSVPAWLTGLVISAVVLFYVFLGGVRSAAWANTFQTIVFMIMGLVGFLVIADGLEGLAAASQKALEYAPEKTVPRRIDDTGTFYELHAGAAECRHVPTFIPALVDCEERQILSTDGDRTPGLHHDRLGALHPDRNLGGWLACRRDPPRSAVAKRQSQRQRSVECDGEKFHG